MNLNISKIDDKKYKINKINSDDINVEDIERKIMLAKRDLEKNKNNMIDYEISNVVNYVGNVILYFMLHNILPLSFLIAIMAFIFLFIKIDNIILCGGTRLTLIYKRKNIVKNIKLWEELVNEDTKSIINVKKEDKEIVSKENDPLQSNIIEESIGDKNKVLIHHR